MLSRGSSCTAMMNAHAFTSLLVCDSCLLVQSPHLLRGTFTRQFVEHELAIMQPTHTLLTAATCWRPPVADWKVAELTCAAHQDIVARPSSHIVIVTCRYHELHDAKHIVTRTVMIRTTSSLCQVYDTVLQLTSQSVMCACANWA